MTATATDSSNNTSEFSNCVQVQAASAELAVTATDSPDPVIVGTQLGYSVTLTNNGPSPATNARITFVWNAAVTIDAATPSQGACEMTPLLVCSFGTVADDASVTVGIAVRPNVIGPLTTTMTAQAAESDPVPGNNAAAVNTSVIGGPSSFLVTNANDSGAGSLRQAILNANASSGSDAISFGIPSAEGQTITLASPLPAITESVSISGATQPGFAGTPIVELNGNGIAGSGLTVSAANTTLSGLVINRFNGPGIQIIGNNTTNTFVQGNYIGTDLTGTLARPNAVGIQIGNTVTSPTNSLIGGTTAATRNVISGNTGSGVVLPTGNGHAVTGNYIGTSADGAGDLGNGGAGVWIVSATNTAVGATAPGAGNVISGNNQHGVLISGSPATLHGNLIGTNAAGDAGVPNGLDGIRIEFASGNTIGGVPGFGNTIAFNTGSGLTIQTGTSNRISGNSIHSNGALGIDLLPVGVTPNDAGDADTGPNNLLNFPVLTAVTGGVQGTLNSTPNGTFRIEFFRNPTCDASGNGEGATFLGTTTVTTDVTGNGTIPLFTAAGGQLVVATATDSSNNTSEFSSCVQTGGQPALTSVVPASAAQGVTLDVALTGVNTTFASGTTTVGFGAGIAVNSVTVTSPTSATANITVSPTAFTGGRTVTVTTGTEVVTSAFAVTAGPALLSSISPTSGQQGQTNLTLTVTGQNTHFVQDVTTATLGGGVIVNLVTVNSPTSATVNLSIEPFAQDARVVVLTTGGENAASAADAFRILPGTPRLTSVTPGSGQQGQTLTVSVVGQFTSFVNGTTTASFGPGVTVNGVNVTSATTANSQHLDQRARECQQPDSDADDRRSDRLVARRRIVLQRHPRSGRDQPGESGEWTSGGGPERDGHWNQHAFRHRQHGLLVRRRHHDHQRGDQQPDERDVEHRDPSRRCAGGPNGYGDDARRGRRAREWLHGRRWSGRDCDRIPVDGATGRAAEPERHRPVHPLRQRDDDRERRRRHHGACGHRHQRDQRDARRDGLAGCGARRPHGRADDRR